MASVGGAYMKFSRYMLPVFAPLAICGAAALGALSAWGLRRLRAVAEGPTRLTAHDRGAGAISSRFAGALGHVALGRTLVACVCLALALGVCWPPAFTTLALINIYSQPNTRVQASGWIYDHVPAGSVLTNEIWDDPLPIGAPAGAHRCSGHRDTPPAARSSILGNITQVGLNLYDEDTAAEGRSTLAELASANVIVISSQRLLQLDPQAARPLSHDDPLL